MRRRVVFYETQAGAQPVARFLRKQPLAVQGGVAAAFKHIATQTQTIHEFKKMVGTDGLWEIRVKKAGNIFRFLCFFDGVQIVVVASGFQKKTQKTPLREIRTAEQRKKDYFRRKNQ